VVGVRKRQTIGIVPPIKEAYDAFKIQLSAKYIKAFNDNDVLYYLLSLARKRVSFPLKSVGELAAQGVKLKITEEEVNEE
jgi:hypothetical protein